MRKLQTQLDDGYSKKNTAHQGTEDLADRYQLLKNEVVVIGVPKDRFCCFELVVGWRREEMFAYNSKIWVGTGGSIGTVGTVDIF